MSGRGKSLRNIFATFVETVLLKVELNKIVLHCLLFFCLVCIGIIILKFKIGVSTVSMGPVCTDTQMN